jgi:fermentation-respiration switch protein FrsA (DUF1100 family)
VDLIALEVIPSRGVTLLSFDLWMHGDRIPPEGKPTARTVDRLLTSMVRCAHDLITVCAYLKTDPAINEHRVGVHGYSYSANVALVALGMGVPVHACLSISGAGDLAGLFAYLAHQGEIPSAQIAQDLSQEHDRVMELNPLYHVDRFPPRPIMMIHGLHDIITPFSAHFALYQALLPHYRSQSGDCLFVAHADGHWTPDTVKRMAFAWLAERVIMGVDTRPS